MRTYIHERNACTIGRFELKIYLLFYAALLKENTLKFSDGLSYLTYQGKQVEMPLPILTSMSLLKKATLVYTY